jgi:hypothetical protein
MLSEIHRQPALDLLAHMGEERPTVAARGLAHKRILAGAWP